MKSAKEILDENCKPSMYGWLTEDSVLKAMEIYKGIWQDQAITLHKILYKILNESKPSYTEKEKAAIKQIIDQHLNEDKYSKDTIEAINVAAEMVLKFKK